MDRVLHVSINLKCAILPDLYGFSVEKLVPCGNCLKGKAGDGEAQNKERLVLVHTRPCRLLLCALCLQFAVRHHSNDSDIADQRQCRDMPLL
ncbi:hypothetical protein F7725_027945 [Dissostichus mawsoni]|uniref:Uncharacterized protein n=1 Tax=Dissostichus mawsoni TaxID=36200 RepID=A0A7J5XFM8_DISMA|nr:hypothetical protein F7725_027945 [Dissostichus mawsoni]